MLFVMLGEYVGTPTTALLEEHVAWLVPQFESGAFVVSGGLAPVAGSPASALAILEADSLEEAEALLAEEPFFRAGVVHHRVVPFTPRVRTTGIDERLTVPELLRVVPRQGATASPRRAP